MASADPDDRGESKRKLYRLRTDFSSRKIYSAISSHVYIGSTHSGMLLPDNSWDEEVWERFRSQRDLACRFAPFASPDAQGPLRWSDAPTVMGIRPPGFLAFTRVAKAIEQQYPESIHLVRAEINGQGRIPVAPPDTYSFAIVRPGIRLEVGGEQYLSQKHHWEPVHAVPGSWSGSPIVSQRFDDMVIEGAGEQPQCVVCATKEFVEFAREIEWRDIRFQRLNWETEADRKPIYVGHMNKKWPPKGW